MFSPKVLDRANVIEFRVDENEMESFLSGNTTLNFERLESKGISMAADFLTKSQTTYQSKDSDSDIKVELLHFFKELKKVGAEFGYRTASEIIRFVQVVKELEPAWTNDQILDAAIMQKLLPKLHGSRRKLEETLRSLAALCLHDQTLASDSISLKKSIDINDKDKVKFPISLEKIRRMNISLINNNFTSYAEA
jgi:5-methylcytosine-specific restriction enzyme B